MRQLKITKQITGRESYSIEKYLQEIGKMGVLNPEEEVELAKQVRLGNKKAKERLVKANLRFVVSVAKQYQNYGLTLGDLINEGNLGLIKAAECFDETKGFKFISYAVWWIRQSILQAIAENARIIRLPLNKISTINKLNKSFALLEQKFQRDPTTSEIAKDLDLTSKDVEEGLKISSRPMSLDAPISGDDENITLYDVYTKQDGGVRAPEEIIFNESLRIDIERSLSLLNERESEIILMYFGLADYPPMSLEEIGSRLGLTSERVRQLKSKALRKLKSPQNLGRLKTYL